MQMESIEYHEGKGRNGPFEPAEPAFVCITSAAVELARCSYA
jgi:hypothetical protein